MPKKIEFVKKGGKFEFEIIPYVNPKQYQSKISLPMELGKLIKGKKVKVIIDPINSSE